MKIVVQKSCADWSLAIFYMSPLLLHSNTNQYNINGLLCTYTEMFRIHTCCNHILSAAGGFRGRRQHAWIQEFFQFYVILSLFYSLQRGSNGFIAEKTILILYQGSRGGPLFSRGGGVSNLFQGGPNANFYRNPYTYLLFSRGRGGGSGPHIPLWIRTWAMSSIIFITVPLLTMIVRHALSGLMTGEVFQMMHCYCARLTQSRNTALGSGSFCNSAFFSPKYPLAQRSESNNIGDWLIQSKKDGKDQESIQSSTTPDPGYQMGK